MPSNFWGCILLATWQSLPSCKFYVKFGLSLQSFLQLKKHKCVKPPPIQRSRTRKFLDLHVRCLETQKKSNKNTINKSKLWDKKKIRIESSPSETTRPWNIRFPHKKKHPLPKGSAVLNKLNLKNLPRKKQTKPSWPKKGHNKSTNLDLPSMKLTCSPLKMDGLWDDPFLLGGNAFFPVLLLFLFVSGRVDMSLPFFWGVLSPFPKPKKKLSYMGVSENNGTPKSSHFNRVFHSFHHPFWGPTPIVGNTHMATNLQAKLPAWSSPPWKAKLTAAFEGMRKTLGWLVVEFQPSWKICASQIGWESSPRFGVNIKKCLSCHQLAWVDSW